jgi:hypothetical protein
MIGAKISTNAGSIAAQFQALRGDIRRRVAANVARVQGQRMTEFARGNLRATNHVESGALLESIGSGVVLKGSLGGYLVTTGPRANFKRTWSNGNQTYFTRTKRNAERARARGLASVVTGAGRVKHPIQYAMWIEKGMRAQRRSKWVKGRKQTRVFTQIMKSGPSHFMANVFSPSHRAELEQVMGDKVHESIQKNMKAKG